jgi:hypothetical protein
MSTAGANAAGTPATNAGAPSQPPAAGPGGTPPLECAAGLDLCSAMCVDLSTDHEHCGSCDKRCNDTRSCSSGRCQKGADAALSNDVVALATLLALFGLDLSDLADALDVDEEDLGSTEITLDDLEDLGLTEAALGLLGFTIEALGLIGVDVSGN